MPAARWPLRTWRRLMLQLVHLTPPAEGAAITRRDGVLIVPDKPIAPYTEGDGT